MNLLVTLLFPIFFVCVAKEPFQSLDEDIHLLNSKR